MSRRIGDLVEPDWQSRLFGSVLIFGLLLAWPGPAAATAAGDALPDGLTTAEWQEVRQQIEGDTETLAGGPTQEAYLRASNPGNTDFFGYSVALDGDTLVVGALAEDSAATGVGGNQNDESASDSGAAYVFVRSGNIWTQQAYLKASNTESEDYFGISVAIDGDTVVVGAYGEASVATGVGGNQANNSAPFAGAAYVFVRSGTTWTQQAYLKASNTEEYDLFGNDVAIEADLIVVGAPGEDGGGGGLGAAYTFTRSGTVWSAPTYLKPTAAVGTAAFGRSLALDAGTLVVGAPGEQNTGAAYVFVRSGNAFVQQGYLRAPQPGAADRFGTSVDIYGNTVVAGAPGEDSSSTGVGGPTNESSPDSGAAYVFRRTSGVWSFQAFLKASNTQAGDAFGSAVSVYSDKVAVGAYLEDGGGDGVGANPSDNSAPDAGATFVFQRLGVSWSLLAYIKASASDNADQFGNSLVLDGATLAVGANWEDGPPGFGGSSQSGAVYVFNVPTSSVSLSVPASTITAYGEVVSMPVSLQTGGLPIAGVSFSLEYDDTCLDPDINNDSVPDTLVWNLPPGFTGSAMRSGANRLNFSIFDVVPPISLLPDGLLVAVGSEATCGNQPPVIFTDTPVVFSPTLPPTFSDDFGQDLEGGSSNGSVRIWAGLAGDCNASLAVTVADLIAVGLEIFDGDGDFWYDSPNPTYLGNPVGCDANHNTRINAADVTCANRRIFELACSPDRAETHILQALPDLEVRSRFEGGIVWTSAVLIRQGHPVGSLAFSLLLDGTVYDLSSIDQNDDGIPDQVVFPQGEAGLSLINYHPMGPTRGRLDILLADLSQQPLPDGTLVELGLPAPALPPIGSLHIAPTPKPSFGSTIGFEIPGTFRIEGEGIFSDGFESGDVLAWSQVAP